MQEKRDGRIVIKGAKARKALRSGVRAAYSAVTSTFGAKGTNVLIEKPFGRPLTTRDGVTVARETYFSDRAKNLGTQRVMEAAETTNRVAGDGTTATVALTTSLYEYGIQAIASGVHPMTIADTIRSDCNLLLQELDTIAKPVSEGQLAQVATVSSGDANLGVMIAEALERGGADGGVITEKAFLPNVELEYIDGYYLQSGYEALASGKKQLIDPWVIVSLRRLTTVADIFTLLNNIARAKNHQQGSIPRVLFIGNIEEAAYNHIVNLNNQGGIDAIIVKTPGMYGAMGKQLLEDIAIFANCDPITDSTKLEGVGVEHAGSLQKVVATKTDSTLFADEANKERKDVQIRVAEIKDQLNLETSDAVSEKLRDRIAKLEGKIAIFKIGGATDSVKEEVEFRVEDSINATRAAIVHGVVPGGGVTWYKLSQMSGISSTTKNALLNVFKKLIQNANLSPDLLISELSGLKSGMGYNLRTPNPKPIDIVKAGILDPKLVVEQVITNACATASDLLTTDTLIVSENKGE